MANSRNTPCATCPGGQCLVGPYEEIKEECNKRGGQAHHVPPDWTMRQGTRKEALKAKKSSDRIFGLKKDGTGKKRMPSLQKGPSICLQGNKNDENSAHSTAHECDEIIENTKFDGIPENTIPLAEVLFSAVDAVTNAAPECEQEIQDAVDEAYEDFDQNTLVRNKQYPKRKGDRFSVDAMKAWKSGSTGSN